MPVSKPPAKLKALIPFITRAHQIEKTDPVIAYWCYFWAVQLVLSGNLHSGDAEATQYTTALLDDLEARKEKLLPNDAVTDDLAAQAYIENFAIRVFNNADNTLQARKVTRQTADNFLAASTFLELCKIFPTVDPEILSKIKFSKYQASRIIKAIQAGEDPNLPAPEATKGTVSPTHNPEKPGTTPPPRPTVEDAQDEDSHLHPHPQFHPGSASPPNPPPVTLSSSTNAPPPATATTFDRFPIHHNTHPHAHNNNNSDTEYFPTIPIGRSLSPISPDRTTSNTPAGPMSPFHMPGRAEPPLHPPPADIIRTTDTDDISNFPPPHFQYPSAPPLTQFPPQHFDRSSALHISHSYTPPPPPPSMPYGASSIQHQFYSTPSPAPAPVHNSPPRSVPQPPPQSQYYDQPKPAPKEPMVDEESVAKAQKHAKWAISALNYDDIPTAVKELRAALKILGAN